MKQYFNTHCHLQYLTTNEDLEKVLENCMKNKVLNLVNVAVNRKDSKNFILQHKNIFEIFPEINVFYSIGLHPSNSETPYDNIEDDLDGAISIGETGFDFYHETNPSIEKQIKNFSFHKNASLKHNKPLIIHSRNASQITVEQLEKNTPKFLIHCFTETIDFAKKILELGGLISFSGIITYKSGEHLKEVIKYCPLDRILIETDDPYLLPKSCFSISKKNEPSFVCSVFDEILKTRSETPDYLNYCLLNNSKKFFNL